MSLRFLSRMCLLVSAAILALVAGALSQEKPATAPAAAPKAFIDGTGPGWRDLVEADFAQVNCDKETWSFKNGEIHCTGKPVGVMRTAKEYTNFELVLQWRHLKPAGNSGSSSGRPKNRSKDSNPTPCPTASRCRFSTMATPNSTRSRAERRPTGSPRMATSFPSASRR